MGFVIVAIVVVGVIIYLMTGYSVDYWPPNGTLSVEKIAYNAVTFTIQDPVWGVDGPVKFDNCAIDFRINGTRIGPNDFTIGSGNRTVRATHGCGLINATVFADGSVNYIIFLNDMDSDGNVSEGDTICLVATEPFRPSTTYAVLFLTELRSSWSFGSFEGSYTA
ncbi:MAG: hypothetical protein LUQ27_07000 [Methanomassiliicoccales archaeon]|nr:hypothetical protein [Methanomassiliicoccales archaeon]